MRRIWVLPVLVGKLAGPLFNGTGTLSAMRCKKLVTNRGDRSILA
jgi:hypothetical protein